MRILLIDNFDSFTYNLSHYLQIGGAEVVVLRNHELGDAEREMNGYDGAVLSPGPGTPEEAPGLMEFVQRHSGLVPILGVCLGMQAIGIHHGWRLLHAKTPVHGKSRLVAHTGHGVFAGIPSPMMAGRYHSLIIDNPDKSGTLIEQAHCEGEVMAVSSPDNKTWGIQFHPESVLTPMGQTLINNWLRLAEKI